MAKNFGFNDEKDFLAALKEQPDVKFVRFLTADIRGERECSFTVPSHTLDVGSFNKGFDASSMYPERINESDKVAKLDPTTARIFPVEYKTATKGFERTWKEAIIFGDIVDKHGKPYVYDSRHKLKEALAMAKQVAGADTVNVGPELEFFLFKAENGGALVKDRKPVTLDQGTYFKSGRFGEVRKEAQLFMEEMGYEFEYDHHEVAPSQHEIDIKYMNAIDMADFILLYRYAVKRIAREHGLFASFMPKPLLGENGSGMHVHQSLFKNGVNIFFDKDDEHDLSVRAYQYMAGLMKYIPEITAFTNQWVNSYRRLVPGFEAPVYICWDPQNRSNLIRKPEYEAGNEKATRLELRSPDPAVNPYLAFAMMISAGIKGIEEKLPAPKASEMDVYHLTGAQRDAHGIKSLPGSLDAAVDLAEGSALVKSVVGERFLEGFVKDKRAQAEVYNAELKVHPERAGELTDYELEKLLPIL